MEIINPKSNVSKEKNTLNKSDKKKYSFMAKFNGNVYKYEVNDLKEAFKRCKPLSLKTKVILHIESEKGVCERVFMVQKARGLFQNERVLEAFIHNLIFKQNVA